MESLKSFIDRMNFIDLFPGILILGELLISEVLKIGKLSNEFLDIVFFIVLSYSVGSVNTIISRALVDWLSENTTRYLMLDWLAHIDLEKAIKRLKDKNHNKNYQHFIDDLEKELGRKRFSKRISKWNSVYRGTLTQGYNNNELKERRNKGRAVRNLFIPLILGYFVLCKGQCFPVWVHILSVFGLIIFDLILYSYSELTTFAEANDIIRKEN